MKQGIAFALWLVGCGGAPAAVDGSPFAAMTPAPDAAPGDAGAAASPEAAPTAAPEASAPDAGTTGPEGDAGASADAPAPLVTACQIRGGGLFVCPSSQMQKGQFLGWGPTLVDHICTRDSTLDAGDVCPVGSRCTEGYYTGGPYGQYPRVEEDGVCVVAP